jgi:hypothetical protein
MLSTRAWSALSVLRETVRCRVWIRVLRLRRRSLLLMVLLMYNARGSRLLKMMRRWRTLLRVMRMMLSITDALRLYQIFRRLTGKYKRHANVRDLDDSRRASLFNVVD